MYRCRLLTTVIFVLGTTIATATEPPISLERLAEIRTDLDRVEEWIREHESAGAQDRIQKAARELEQAGRPDWAAAIRSGRNDREIELRRQKIAQLQAEIVELQQNGSVFNSSDQFTVDVQIIEADVEKLRELGFNFDQLARRNSKSQSFQVVDRREVFQEWFDQMREEGAAKVVSQPKIITQYGRPAAMFVGGKFPVPVSDLKFDGVELVPYGLKISVEGQRQFRGMSLAVDAQQSSPNFRATSRVTGSARVDRATPVLRHFEVKSESKVLPGEAIFIYAVKDHAEEGERAVLMLIEPNPVPKVATRTAVEVSQQ